MGGAPGAPLVDGIVLGVVLGVVVLGVARDHSANSFDGLDQEVLRHAVSARSVVSERHPPLPGRWGLPGAVQADRDPQAPQVESPLVGIQNPRMSSMKPSEIKSGVFPCTTHRRIIPDFPPQPTGYSAIQRASASCPLAK